MRLRSIKGTLCICLAGLILPTTAAAADERWSLRGAGWGHGVGMSQYGALGFARHGYSYRQILSHYYRGTAIGRRATGAMRVLLQANRSTVAFTGATQVAGRGLDPDSTYKATRQGSSVVLRSSSGRELKSYAGLLRVTGGETVQLLGAADNGVRDGLYRGALEIRTAAGPGLNAVNAVGLESYLRGVVPSESPASWPLAALKAQAVAARSYALATGGGEGFDQYADTRSQVYRGYLAEAASTNRAVGETAGKVVTYGGQVAVTYFFSTSGGETENVENVFLASAPKPWLKGVDDPYDGASPYHRWGPFTWSSHTLELKLGSYVEGRFRDIKVLKRGTSPRVVMAQVRGSRGSTTVTGPQLRARLGLRDTWFYLRRVSTETSPAKARTSHGTRKVTALYGSVRPARARFVRLQHRAGRRWLTVEQVPLELRGRTGRYRIHVGEAGTYRIMAGWARGPIVRART